MRLYTVNYLRLRTNILNMNDNNIFDGEELVELSEGDIIEGEYKIISKNTDDLFDYYVLPYNEDDYTGEMIGKTLIQVHKDYSK